LPWQASASWALRIDDQLEMPRHWFTGQWPPASISASLEAHVDAATFKEQLRSIRARGRDDPFEVLLEGKSAS